jgi:NAD(P)-dependent dehydrogenase (short-subunit alcohol dehydrogenase family)
MAKELEDDGIRVNTICPGWVRTDMGGPDANKSIEEGADTAVWLATADKIENGKFYADRKVIPW